VKETHWALACLALVPLAVAPAAAQEPGDTASVGPEQALRVFLDCQPCDFDHFRREVPYVNYVRDRLDAQVHVLVTTRGTASGGREFTFAFIGLQEFQARQDALIWISAQGDTQDDVRDGQVRTFQLGLMRYVADTPLAGLISIGFEGLDEAEQVVSPEDDPWDFWVFDIGVSGAFEGEERQSEASLDGSIEASRVTEDLKIELETEVEWNHESFELSDRTEKSTTRDYSSGALVVWSVGPHWSVGAEASARTSTLDNQDLTLRAGPAVEYSFYPYGESTRRQITLQYRVGFASYDYEVLTLFDRTEETRAEHNLDLSADFTQPWGELGGSLEVEMFLDDPAQHRIDLFSNLELRITRGLSLDIRGNVARVKNQIYVPRDEDISDEDVLLERRRLGTDYEFELEVGISFTFGSIFNNVVNPRLGGGGGGGGGGGDFF